MEAKNVTGVICLIFLAFFGIPIRIKKPDLPQDELAFKSYILRFNKSYVNNETEYKIRFENFKVGYVTFFFISLFFDMINKF